MPPVSAASFCEEEGTVDPVGAAKLLLAAAATHGAVGTFERAGWLGFDRVVHEQQTLTIFATKTG